MVILEEYTVWADALQRNRFNQELLEKRFLKFISKQNESSGPETEINKPEIDTAMRVRAFLRKIFPHMGLALIDKLYDNFLRRKKITLIQQLAASLDELLVELAIERLKELILTIYKTVESDGAMREVLSKAKLVKLPAKSSSSNGLGPKKSASSLNLDLRKTDTSPTTTLPTYIPNSENMTPGSNGTPHSPSLFSTIKTNERNSEGQGNIDTIHTGETNAENKNKFSPRTLRNFLKRILSLDLCVIFGLNPLRLNQKHLGIDHIHPDH